MVTVSYIYAMYYILYSPPLPSGIPFPPSKFLLPSVARPLKKMAAPPPVTISIIHWLLRRDKSSQAPPLSLMESWGDQSCVCPQGCRCSWLHNGLRLQDLHGSLSWHFLILQLLNSFKAWSWKGMCNIDNLFKTEYVVQTGVRQLMNFLTQ